MTELKELGLPTDKELEQMRKSYTEQKREKHKNEKNFEEFKTGWRASTLCNVIPEKENTVKCVYRDNTHQGIDQKNLHLFDRLAITPNSLDSRRMLLYDRDGGSIFIPLKSGAKCSQEVENGERTLICTMEQFDMHPSNFEK